MAAETWLTAKEAKEGGFCDHIYEDNTEKAEANPFDLSAFANVPIKLKEQNIALTARGAEQALRDVGCTKKQAKSILSGGWETGCRDDDPVDLIPAQSVQRDVEPERDKVSDLLIRAEIMAPSNFKKDTEYENSDSI